jgi:hypothetical protein
LSAFFNVVRFVSSLLLSLSLPYHISPFFVLFFLQYCREADSFHTKGSLGSELAYVGAGGGIVLALLFLVCCLRGGCSAEEQRGEAPSDHHHHPPSSTKRNQAIEPMSYNSLDSVDSETDP